MIKAYVYSSCTSCRKTEEVLKQSGAEYESRDFFRRRFSIDEMKSILSEAGLTAADVLSKRSKVYKARGDEIEKLDDEALLALMVDKPTLLRRPLVTGGNDVIVGHNPGQLESMIAANNG